MKLTPRETKVLKAMAFNHYGEGTCTWSWAMNESRAPSGIKGKELSGVIASLAKKGLLSVEKGETKKDDAIYTTEAGKAAMVKAGWMKEDGMLNWEMAK
jgi:hypothetical protein